MSKKLMVKSYKRAEFAFTQQANLQRRQANCRLLFSWQARNFTQKQAPRLSRIIGSLCVMDKTEAIYKIKASLEHHASRGIPKGVDGVEFIKQQSNFLLESAIEPERVSFVFASFPGADFDLYNSSVVWAIARHNENWLLTIQGKNSFALGFGHSTNDIEMLGFSSENALGEWCG